MGTKALKIVIADDSNIFRFAIKKALQIKSSKTINQFDFFESKDGFETLGLVFASRADISIIDTTLPKYSGKEVFEYLSSNETYVKENKLVILIDDGSIANKKFHDSFSVIDKNDPKFVERIRYTVLSFYYYLFEKNSEIVSKRMNLFRAPLGTLNAIIRNANEKEILSIRLREAYQKGFISRFIASGLYVFQSSLLKLKYIVLRIILFFF